MGGEVRKVCSHVGKFYSDYINSFDALIVSEKGCVGHLDRCYSAGGRVHNLEMHAEEISAYGSIPFESDRQEALILGDNRPYGRAEIMKNQDSVDSEELHKCYGYYQGSRHFVDCIRQDK